MSASANNAKRRIRADRVLALVQASEAEAWEGAVDVLTDLLHLTGGALDLESVVRVARGHYEAEAANECE